LGTFKEYFIRIATAKEENCISKNIGKGTWLMFQRCCYMTVDFATAASQTGFSTCKLSLHKKTKIIQKWQKS
jgi:hypothetical protein